MPNPPIFAPVPYAITQPDGTVEKFAIKPLSISKLYDWLYLARDQREPAMVALATGHDLSWVDGLDVDTFAKLAAKCNEVLFPMALRLAKGAPGAAALVAPIMQSQMKGLQVISILSSGSGAQSATPPPSGSAAGTPPPSQTPSASTDSATSSAPGNG